MGEIVEKVVIEALSRSSSFIAENLMQNTQVEVRKKLRRVDNLIIKIFSAVSLSENVKCVNNYPLQEWQARLNQTAHEGRQVLNTMREIEQFGDSLNAVRCIKRFVLGDADINQLNDILEKLEEASHGLGDFLRILELELELQCAERKEKWLRKVVDMLIKKNSYLNSFIRNKL